MLIDTDEEFAKAPITEAIIEFRVATPDDVTITALKSLEQTLGDRYPKVAQQVHRTVGVQLAEGDAPQAEVESESESIRFETEDGHYVAQLRPNSFSFSVMAPYKNWAEFTAEAQAVWEKYLEIAKPISIVRIATRFINVVQIPKADVIDYDDYFTAGPKVPDGLPQTISGFLSRVIIVNGEIGAYAIVTQTVEPPTESFLPYILDVDVISEKQFDARDGAYWVQLEQLRHFKNDIFRRSITKKAKDLFR